MGRFTQKQYYQHAARIKAKIQKWAPNIRNKIFDALIKELTKIGLDKGLKALGDIFHNL